MELKRFVITRKSTGEFVAGIYAERFAPFYPAPQPPGPSNGVHFWIGKVIIASVEVNIYDIVDPADSMFAVGPEDFASQIVDAPHSEYLTVTVN